MENNRKIVVAVLSGLSIFSLIFWVGLYFCGGLSYLYSNQEVVNDILVFVAIAVAVLIVYITIIVSMFKCKKAISIVCAFLLILTVPVSLFGSFIYMLGTSIIGTSGCSYTEDVASYGKYDEVFNTSYFPTAITDDMTVVDFVYFYKYADADQIDIFLEVKFDNKETMDEYLSVAKKAFSENGITTYQNPYNPKYTDIIENKTVLWSNNEKYSSVISFEGREDYKFVLMQYNSITYSYEELTIIYNYTHLGSDIKVGNKPNDCEYYSRFLERFGVEWNSDNNFKYKFVEA